MNLKAECHEIGRRNHVHSVSFAYCGNRGRVPVEPLVHEILYYSLEKYLSLKCLNPKLPGLDLNLSSGLAEGP